MRRICRTNLGVECKQSSPPKVLTNSLYEDTSLIRKFFADRSVFTFGAYRVPGLFIFPRWLHSTGSCGGLAPPLLRQPTTNAPSSNHYVFRVARLVHEIASWPGFTKEYSTNFDNHSKFLSHQPYIPRWNIKYKRSPEEVNFLHLWIFESIYYSCIKIRPTCYS